MKFSQQHIENLKIAWIKRKEKGFKSPFSIKETQNKAKETIFKKYGVNNVSELEWVKKKIGNSNQGEHENRNCLFCHKEFKCRKKSKQKCCSKNCANSYKLLPRSKRNCLQCNKEFEYQINDDQKFCCNKCVNKHNRTNQERNKKISLSNKGKKKSEEHSRNISLSKKLEKHPAWLGGKSFEPYGLEFNKSIRNQIKERDNHICQICKLDEEKLKFLFKKDKYIFAIHHIDYDKKNNNKDNLISLCIPCHIKTNQNRDYWRKEFKRVKEGVNNNAF